MIDQRVKKDISILMQAVQDAAASDKDASDSDYIADVNERIGEIQTALSLLKHELTKHGLNDW